MKKLFMNFELTTEFFIMIGLFLSIAFVITIIIVYFLTKIKNLNSFLGEAKEIDDSKNEKIAGLEIQLQEEKIYNINIMSKLKDFEKNKKSLSEKEKEIIALKENISLLTQEHKISFYQQDNSLKELKSEHNKLHDEYDNLIEKYRLLQKRNETLVKENNTFHSRLREIQVQLDEQKKQNVKKSVETKGV